MKIPYRIRQIIYYARADHQPPPGIELSIGHHLNEIMETQFRILPSGDQRHLLRVYRYLEAHGAEEDTKVAGLLHDVGKACRNCNITIVDRCFHVFLNRFFPGPYRQFARMNQPPNALRSLNRLANHASRGAEAVRQAGYNERVQWLIQYHEKGGGGDDTQLRLLREADNTAGVSYDE